jgi:cobalamin biosynthesis Mg chelatase CobN
MIMRMQKFPKSQAFKLAAGIILTLSIMLSFLIQVGRADTQHQTIPTAPPSTATITIILPSETPTIPPQSTVVATQPTHVLASQTPSSTATPTRENIVTTPSIAPSGTGLPNNGTIPQLSATFTLTETSATTPTSTGVQTEASGSSGMLIGLLVGGMVVILVIGVGWYLNSRRRTHS